MAGEDETAGARNLESGNTTEAPPKEGLVYAELDLVRENLRPVVKNDDEKTEYAEIVYAKQGDGDGEDKKVEK